MHMPDPTFPPLLTGHAVRGNEPAFETACARAAGGELGAGDVVWSRDTALIDLAVILEPDVPLETAVQMLPLAMVALGDLRLRLRERRLGRELVASNRELEKLRDLTLQD